MNKKYYYAIFFNRNKNIFIKEGHTDLIKGRKEQHGILPVIAFRKHNFIRFFKQRCQAFSNKAGTNNRCFLRIH